MDPEASEKNLKVRVERLKQESEADILRQNYKERASEQPQVYFMKNAENYR